MAGSPKRIPSLKQGSLGWVTTSSAVPARMRSPTKILSSSGRPRTVRFSPKLAQGSSLPSAVSQNG